MNSARTEAVARKVAEVLGDEVNPRGPWFIIVSPATHAEELLCLSAAEYLSDLNVAGRVWKKISESPEAETLAGFVEVNLFPVKMLEDCPRALDALLVAAGLLEPEDGDA